MPKEADELRQQMRALIERCCTPVKEHDDLVAQYERLRQRLHEIEDVHKRPAKLGPEVREPDSH